VRKGIRFSKDPRMRKIVVALIINFWFFTENYLASNIFRPLPNRAEKTRYAVFSVPVRQILIYCCGWLVTDR
jgi:hypothetical protein